MEQPNTNPLSGVPFGQEATREDFLARAAWEYDQAASLLATRPVGYSGRVGEHERAAKEYARRALRTDIPLPRNMQLHEQLITVLRKHGGNIYIQPLKNLAKARQP